MRHQGAISQVNIEREKEIMSLYRQAKAIAGFPATIDRICHIMANLPCSKYYVSDYWALRYVEDRQKGKIRRFRSRKKHVLYSALYATVQQLAKSAQYRGSSLETIVDAALEKPAPIIGLSPSFIKNVLRYKLNIYQYEKN